METFGAARKVGKERFIAFSAPSREVGLAAMERFSFDTILFPINFVLFSRANFGPEVIEKARKIGMRKGAPNLINRKPQSNPAGAG